MQLRLPPEIQHINQKLFSYKIGATVVTVAAFAFSLLPIFWYEIDFERAFGSYAELVYSIALWCNIILFDAFIISLFWIIALIAFWFVKADKAFIQMALKEELLKKIPFRCVQLQTDLGMTFLIPKHLQQLRGITEQIQENSNKENLPELIKPLIDHLTEKYTLNAIKQIWELTPYEHYFSAITIIRGSGKNKEHIHLEVLSQKDSNIVSHFAVSKTPWMNFFSQDIIIGNQELDDALQIQGKEEDAERIKKDLMYMNSSKVIEFVQTNGNSIVTTNGTIHWIKKTKASPEIKVSKNNITKHGDVIDIADQVISAKAHEFTQWIESAKNI